MSKTFPFTLGLLVIVSLGASSVLAGGGPDPERTAAEAYGAIAQNDPAQLLPDSMPTAPSGPGVPGLSPDGGSPVPPGVPDDAPDAPEEPTRPDDPAPDPQVPDAPQAPEVSAQTVYDEVDAATSSLEELLSPFKPTAEALSLAANRLVATGIGTGIEMVGWIGGQASAIGNDKVDTVMAVIQEFFAEEEKTDTNDGYGAFTLGPNAAAANVVRDTSLATVVTLFAIGSMGAAFAGFAVARRLLSLGGLALLSRIPSKDIMKNGTRAAVFEIVQTDPGVSLNEIVERLGISRNAVAYHLAVFEQETTMVSIKDGKYRRYFVNGGKFANGAKVVVSAIRNDITRTVAEFIAKNPGVIQKDVCAAVGTSPSATNWHIGRLEKVGLVQKNKVANTVQYQPGPSFAKYDLSDFGLQTAPMNVAA